MRLSAIALLFALSSSAYAAEPPLVLPPVSSFDGASRQIVVPSGDRWMTPAERYGLRSTPDYDETVRYLRRIVAASPQLEMVSIGTSPEGREIWMVVASSDRKFTPEALRASGKPTILAQGGIHSGEIDGKDAGLMLLRDMTVRGNEKGLLRNVNLLFVPIFNVDGHERSSKYNRMNQRGPEESGWRTTSRNLNLNRDYAKADTPEMRSMIEVIERWQPDLYIDLHVTDGEDYRYDITWGYNGPHSHSPAIARWLDGTLTPALQQALRAQGHVPGPLVFGVDRLDLTKGIVGWTADPRFSNGYGDVRHLPTVLVENHSLKPYDQRVLGTYVFLKAAMETVARDEKSLRAAIAADRASRREVVPLAWKVPQDRKPRMIEFEGIDWRVEPSAISGGLVVRWTGEPRDMTIPLLEMTEPVAAVSRPKAYWIHPAWSEVIERLRLHGVAMETIDEPREIEVEELRLTDPKFAETPFEGHVRVTATPVASMVKRILPPGSVRVKTDQPLGDLAILLLEPESPDSFLQWGFFHSIFDRTEYAEAYVMEPTAEAMMKADPELRKEFLAKLASDPQFRSDPDKRLQFFYEKTPWFDARWQIYPVAREK